MRSIAGKRVPIDDSTLPDYKEYYRDTGENVDDLGERSKKKAWKEY